MWPASYSAVMWIPKDEQDILTAVANQSLEETVTFDAKREIPKRNSDTAVDVSALANTAGGVLLYGVDEDEGGHPSIPMPFELSGQRERIDSILRTSVDEVPSYRSFTIPHSGDESKGYLVVVVPPSERAPHMVIVKGERRFYGRGETGNYVLSQAEVARLYERRGQVATSAINEMLDRSISAPPIPANEKFAHLYVVVRPVLSDDALLGKALMRGENIQGMLTKLAIEARDDRRLTDAQYDPDFNPPIGGWSQYPDSYRGRMSYAEEGKPDPDRYTLELTIESNGTGYLFCGRVADSLHGEKIFLPAIAVGNTARMLGMLGRLFERASYYGMVDIGVAITNLQRCINDKARFGLGSVRRYDGPDYRKSLRTSALNLIENPRQVAESILNPILEALS